MSHSSVTDATLSTRSLIKRFGVAGFMFFFLKGLAWLAVPAALATFY